MIMEEKINIAAILKNKPENRFDSKSIIFKEVKE